VLDKLLADGRLSVEAIRANSAGTMNAVVMAYDVSVGSVDGAREKLAEFWQMNSAAGKLHSPMRTTPW
jgi:NTE family protein